MFSIACVTCSILCWKLHSVDILFTVIFIIGTTEPALPAPPPPPSPPPPSPPPPSPPLSLSGTTEEFQAEIRADVTVVKGLQELENSFYNLLVQVMHYLQLNCDLSDAQLFLNGVTGTEDFSSCDNFRKLIRLLQRDHIGTFNIFLLQELVACLKEDDLMKLIQAYEEKKESFLNQTNVRSFQRAVVSRVEPVIPKGRAVVTIKIPIKKVYIQTLTDIEELARKGFDDCHKSFVRLHAEAGLIIVSRVFPETHSSDLEQKNANIPDKVGVEEVTVGGRRKYPVTQQEVRT